MGGVNSASLCYSQKTEHASYPRCRLTKALDLTSTAFLIVAFLTGIAGALQTPYAEPVPDQRSPRASGDGWLLLHRERHHWHPGQPVLAGRSDRKGDRKSLIVFCCLLGVFACVLFAWNQLFHSAVCWGVPEQLRLDRQPADVRPCPRACRPHRAGSGDVQLDTARAGVACVGDWPPLAYALAMGLALR